MPKLQNTIKQRCDKLRERLSPGYVSERTSLFKDQFDKSLDQYTLDECKRRYKLWFDTWVKDELDQLLKK